MAGYSGYLLQVGNTQITGENYINVESYKATINIQDMDSTRNAEGVLVRNALTHAPMKVEFETRENLTNTELQTFQNIFHSGWDAKERKLTLKAFIPEKNDYESQVVYMPDPEINIKRIDSKSNTVYYKPVRFAFIGY